MDTALLHSARPIAPVSRSTRSAARRVFDAAVYTVLAANVVGMAAALVQNVPGPPDGALARDTWIAMGTAYSAPLFLLVLAGLGFVVSGRRGPIGVIGTLVPMIVAALGDLSLTTDWPGVSDAITHHFNVAGFAAIWIIILVYPVVVVAGALDLWSRSRRNRLPSQG